MFSVEDHGSIVLVRPLTRDVYDWLVTSVGQDAEQWFGNALVCEPRYVEPIIHALIEEGYCHA